jgi:hypothetical protein
MKYTPSPWQGEGWGGVFLYLTKLKFAVKDYGEVKTSEKVSGEIKEIDVLFTPSVQQTYNLQVLGLLGRFAEYPAILEP